MVKCKDSVVAVVRQCPKVITGEVGDNFNDDPSFPRHFPPLIYLGAAEQSQVGLGPKQFIKGQISTKTIGV